MAPQMPTREEAWELLTRYNTSDRAHKHALAVEATMRHMAGKLDGDAETWGLVGLIHDLDYEQFPDQHCVKVRELLEGCRCCGSGASARRSMVAEPP